jgi:hypothetical protein
MLHDITSAPTMGRHKEVGSSADETKRLNMLVYDMLDASSDKEHGYTRRMYDTNEHSDVYMTPIEARKHGYIDQIGFPIIVPKIKYDLQITNLVPTEDFEVEEQPKNVPKPNKRTGRKKK